MESPAYRLTPTAQRPVVSRMGSWALLMAIVTALLTGGCVFTLLAQNYYTTEELLECEALIRAVEHEHALPSCHRLRP
jgi:hypothetical protein